MAKQVQLRKGTTSDHTTFTGAEGELSIDTTKKTAVVHDGTTAGGNPLLRTDGGTAINLTLNKATDSTISGAGNYTLDPQSSSFIRVVPASGSPIVVGISGGSDGRILVIYKTGATDLTFADESSTETTAANRISTMSDSDEVITADGVATLIYDGTDSRWIMTSLKP